MNTEFVDMTMVGRIEDPDGEVLVVGAPDRRKMADLHCERHWEYKEYHRKVNLMGYQEGKVLANLRDTEWETHWEQ